MFLVDDDNELNAYTVCISNTVKEIFSLTIPNRCVAFLGNKFPVDECCTSCFKAILQRVKQILRMTMGRKLSHFLSALFFQITLARTKPDERSSAIDLGKILLNKVDKNNCFTGTGGRLYSYCLLRSAISHDVQ